MDILKVGVEKDGGQEVRYLFGTPILLFAIALAAFLPGCPGTAIGGYQPPTLQSGVMYHFEGVGGHSSIGTVESYGPGSWVQIKERDSYGGEIAWVNLEMTSSISVWD